LLGILGFIFLSGGVILVATQTEMGERIAELFFPPEAVLAATVTKVGGTPATSVAVTVDDSQEDKTSFRSPFNASRSVSSLSFAEKESSVLATSYFLQ
jgi:hypothetical protein